MSILVEKWNERYREARVEDARVAQVLTENAHLLPPVGAALDLACGLGGNASFLAEHGLQTLAWDISPQAIRKLQEYAVSKGLPLKAESRDVENNPPGAASFDAIVVAHFLHRPTVPALVAALKPKGLLFYQTFIRDTVDDIGPKNKDFRLAANELLQLFSPLRVLVYREEARVGDTTRGFRNQAMLVGMKV